MTPDEVKEARVYAWAYFALHAEQRMTIFNFFLLFSGLIVGAFPAVRSLAPQAKAVALLPLLLPLASLIFWRLEERTRALVKNGEDALRFLDEQWPVDATLPDKTPHYLRLIQRDDYHTKLLKERWWANRLVPISYSNNFRIVYLIVAGVGLVLAAWVWLS